ncbi:500_t:CDS:1 [Acaulospora morrowiae]|uniref:500_t:CDS:1 n=1 Tax=Acaulospora morrowiae TaxID=94023 RepID=A0A9N9C092_9GLOM|nr:500_t:CDS:1 [Acaulospora morrowiae]
MKKDLLLTRELLIWIQKAIPNEFPFLIRDKDSDVNIHPINNFLAIYGISSSHLKKIDSEYAITIYGNKNDSKRKRLYQLVLRQKLINIASDHYGIMNNKLNIPILRPISSMIKQEYKEIEDIYNLYGNI